MPKLITIAHASFKNLKPSPTAGKNTVKDEPGWVNCKQCGYPLKKDRHSEGNGYGNITTVAVSGGTNVDEPVVNGGCAFCGSSNYE